MNLTTILQDFRVEDHTKYRTKKTRKILSISQRGTDRAH